jgi:pimeloyl-ACP methyl ester carboxylesterase
VSDDPLRVMLERETELAPVRLRFREWPGYGSIVLHLSCGSDSKLIAEVAAALAPACRVLSLELPPTRAVEVSASHVVEFIEQFGFANIVLVGESVTTPIAILVAEWCPNRVAGVLNIDDDVSIEAVTSLVEAQCRRSR